MKANRECGVESFSHEVVNYVLVAEEDFLFIQLYMLSMLPSAVTSFSFLHVWLMVCCSQMKHQNFFVVFEVS